MFCSLFKPFGVLISVVGLVGLSVGQGIGQGQNSQDDNVVYREASDPKVAAATQAAHNTLDRFLIAARAENAAWEGSGLKIALEKEGVIEHIWVYDFTSSDGVSFDGHLANQPVHLPELNIHDEVEFNRGQIEDWSFIQDAKGYGLYSVRIFLDSMEPSEAAQMRAFLSPTPEPEEW
ncbi:MAG: DUF2314 domain-containing protein [Pseudomonadota bacterium]